MSLLLPRKTKSPHKTDCSSPLTRTLLCFPSRQVWGRLPKNGLPHTISQACCEHWAETTEQVGLVKEPWVSRSTISCSFCTGQGHVQTLRYALAPCGDIHFRTLAHAPLPDLPQVSSRGSCRSPKNAPRVNSVVAAKQPKETPPKRSFSEKRYRRQLAAEGGRQVKDLRCPHARLWRKSPKG